MTEQEKLKERNKRPITDFYKQIPVSDGEGGFREHTLFDYEAIWEDIAPLFLIISERGAKGKSTQAKNLMRIIWENYKYKSMWMMNTKELIKKEKKSHVKKPIQYLDSFKGNEYVEGDFAYAEVPGQDGPATDEKEGKKPEMDWYARFTALSVAENEKGSRDDYGLLVYDEFNVGLSQIGSDQTDLISSLIATLSDPVNSADSVFKKFIIHGNFKSLANQLLTDLEVYTITEEVTDVYLGDFLLMRILCPKLTESDIIKIKEDNKNNWQFLLQEKLGKAGHVYYNENLFDEVNNVNPNLIDVEYSEAYNVKIKDYYIQCRVMNYEGKTILYWAQLNEKPETAIALNKNSIKEGVGAVNRFKKNLTALLTGEHAIMMFEKPFIREMVIAELRK